MFGKKKDSSGSGTDNPLTPQVDHFPWQPQSTITGNLAIANLRENLLLRLKNAQGVHTETLMTAIGALAGFAAQNAALNRAAITLSQQGEIPKNSIILAQSAREEYLMGDWINTFLFNDPGSQLTLHRVAGDGAIRTGIVKAQDLPDFTKMVKHVVSTLGKPEFGKMSVSDAHQPMFQPLVLLRKLWLFACEVFRLPLPNEHLSEPPLQEDHWPVVISLVVSQLIGLSRDALSPRISYGLAMESAIIAAKIDPRIIDSGKWDIEASAGKLMVRRLRD